MPDSLRLRPPRRRFLAGGDAELRENLRDVVLGTRHRNVKPPSDLFVRETAAKQIEDFLLSRRELIRCPPSPHGGIIVPSRERRCTSLKLSKPSGRSIFWHGVPSRWRTSGGVAHFSQIVGELAHLCEGVQGAVGPPGPIVLPLTLSRHEE